MSGIRSHKDLRVWQKGMDLVEGVYHLTETLPPTEQWGLIAQMRRAAISVPSNIAEGYGRRTTGEYRRHLAIGHGSLLELETQAILCRRLGFLDQAKSEALLTDIQDVSKMLSSLISKLRQA